jgi:hypothetical protein
MAVSMTAAVVMMVRVPDRTWLDNDFFFVVSLVAVG